MSILNHVKSMLENSKKKDWPKVDVSNDSNIYLEITDHKINKNALDLDISIKSKSKKEICVYIPARVQDYFIFIQDEQKVTYESFGLISEMKKDVILLSANQSYFSKIKFYLNTDLHRLKLVKGIWDVSFEFKFGPNYFDPLTHQSYEAIQKLADIKKVPLESGIIKCLPYRFEI